MKRWLERTWWFLTSWYAPALVGVLLLVGFAVWLWPTRSSYFISADGAKTWHTGTGAPRQVLWEEAQAVDGLLPEAVAGSLLTPRLADGGAALYFAHRPVDGNANLYVARLIDGRWRQAEPITPLNSDSDDLGPVFSKNGRQLIFSSNRPGGHGGFDLYVSNRTETGWSPPMNLGADINSSAHEYDPALNDEGLRLFFASNRVPGVAKSADVKKIGVTVRAHPGLSKFDLYSAERAGLDEPWTRPTPLTELNRPGHNEGAPFLSRGFLYFASDRPAREGEKANLDLYRARLVDGVWKDVENLGPSINSPAHETEPGLSPEGFRLVFSSDRDGGDRLYVSSAREVYAQTEWDTRRLNALAAHWWQILLLMLLLAALFALVYFAHGWMLEKATAARFMLASLLVHLLLLFILGALEVGREIYDQGKGDSDEVVALENIESEGAPAHEQVADLKTLEQPVDRNVSRQATATPNIPRSTSPERPANVPALRTDAPPPERVVLEMPAPARSRSDPSRRRQRIQTPAQAARPNLPALAAEAQPVNNSQPASKANLARQDTPAPRPTEPAPAANRPFTAKVEKPVIERVADANTPTPKPERQARERPRPAQRVAANARPNQADLKLASAPEGGENNPPMPAAKVNVARQSAEPAEPGPAEPTNRPNVLPASFRAANDLRRPAGSPLDDAPMPAANANGRPERNRRRPTRDAVARNSTTAPEGGAVTPAPAGDPAVGLTAQAPGRSKTVPEFPTNTADRPSGPSKPSDPKLRVGALARANLEAPPSFGPRTGPGSRRVSRADRVARTIGRFSLRENRGAAVDKFGGSKESEAAVERGLDWLAAHQNEDGSWSLDKFHQNCKHKKCSGAANVRSDTGATGLALLPFLAARHTQQAGKHRPIVTRGLNWLIEHQRQDGLLETGNYRPFYGHGIAALALCEAYAMTRDPKLRGPAQKALDFIIKHQHGSGGWRYTPGQSSDTSVTGWQVMALRSGELAGLTVPKKTYDGVHRWLKHVEGSKGRFGYTSSSTSPAMTAQGLLCLQMLGARRDDPRLRAGADYLRKHMPRRNSETSYYWYHATQVMFHMQGDYWKAWNESFRDLLVKEQVAKGPMAGSWNPRDAREHTGGRLYATALRLLMLEVYYRHLPKYLEGISKN